MDHVKDWWEFGVVLIGGIFGFGVAYQKQKSQGVRIDDIEETMERRSAQCPHIMTKDMCEQRQDACKEIQNIKYEQLIKSQDNLMLTNAAEHSELSKMIGEIRDYIINNKATG